MKNFIMNWLLPPAFLRLILAPTQTVKWSGKFSTWKEAEKHCAGYSDPLILNKVIQSAEKVLAGKAAFERDSVLFSEHEYNYELISALLYVSIRNKNSLSVLDFGGSLASQYFQHKPFLEIIPKLHWKIVEQPQYVTAGKRLFERERTLQFSESLDSATASSSSDILLLSTVLPYLDDIEAHIQNFLDLDCRYIFIGRTPFLNFDTGKDVITIQTVREPIYAAQYPARLFSKSKLLESFSKKYSIVFDTEIEAQSAPGTTYRSIFLEKK